MSENGNRGGRIGISTDYLMKELHLDSLDAEIVGACLSGEVPRTIILSVIGDDQRLPPVEDLDRGALLPAVIVTMHRGDNGDVSIVNIKGE